MIEISELTEADEETSFLRQPLVAAIVRFVSIDYTRPPAGACRIRMHPSLFGQGG